MPTPLATTHCLAWRDRAACAGKPTSWFFSTPNHAGMIELALATCRGCPVRLECLDDALDFEASDRVTFGVRGGMLASERVNIIRHRPALVAVPQA